MAMLYPGITGNRTLHAMLRTLRPEDGAEALAQVSSAEVVQKTAKWAWALEDGDGNFVASVAIMPDIGRRGWLVSYPGAHLRSAAQLRPLVRLFTIFRDHGDCYDELRAWVASEDRRAIRFAEWGGFRVDCGPATGFSPTGRDMNLMMWRRK